MQVPADNSFVLVTNISLGPGRAPVLSATTGHVMRIGCFGLFSIFFFQEVMSPTGKVQP